MRFPSSIFTVFLGINSKTQKSWSCWYNTSGSDSPWYQMASNGFEFSLSKAVMLWKKLKVSGVNKAYNLLLRFFFFFTLRWWVFQNLNNMHFQISFWCWGCSSVCVLYPCCRKREFEMFWSSLFCYLCCCWRHSCVYYWLMMLFTGVH